MNELQWAAAKKAAIAVLAAVCFILLFRLSPMLSIMLVFLGGVGGGSYMLFMDMEMAKIRAKEYEDRVAKLDRERKEALDKIGR